MLLNPEFKIVLLSSFLAYSIWQKQRNRKYCHIQSRVFYFEYHVNIHFPFYFCIFVHKIISIILGTLFNIFHMSYFSDQIIFNRWLYFALCSKQFTLSFILLSSWATHHIDHIRLDLRRAHWQQVNSSKGRNDMVLNFCMPAFLHGVLGDSSTLGRASLEYSV